MKVFFYMKSGNRIECNNVKDLNYSYEGNRITRLQIDYTDAQNGEMLLVQSIALDQIEAITKVP